MDKSGRGQSAFNELFRKIPKIDKIMETEVVKELEKQYGHETVLEAVRESAQLLREEIFGKEINNYEEFILHKTKEKIHSSDQKQMGKVINATGVILHTNLGRAPLGERLMSELVPLMTGYTNLELNLKDGKRGSRNDHFEEKLCKLTGAEAAIAVNNNAAAVLIMLTALAFGGETIVSRGELVEIGGRFRIPDVCSQSGTRLVETGTTNRTYLEDYEKVVTESTAVFLKVHTSNYQISGFTHEPDITELAKMAHRHGIPLLVDFGSGSIADLTPYEISAEKTVQEFLKKGADIVTFSGDKLLGGPQAGILAGRRDLINKIAAHPLMRALRIDKFTAAALEKTLSIYMEGQKMEVEIPVYKMIARGEEELQKDAQWLVKELADNPEYEFTVTSTRNPVGGGTTPGKTLPGVALQIRKKDRKNSFAQEICDSLRKMDVPVIGHITDDQVCLEMRTILPGELEILKEELKKL